MLLLSKRYYSLMLCAVAIILLNGCSAYFHQPAKQKRARLGEDTRITPGLRTIPGPSEKLVAAVYKFRDQTGQYKPSESGINYSTAVTQGATNILLKALEESGWFVAIERENVSNLLNERKIIRSSMAQYKPDNENLPPLLFAGIILEGGIVSYDANIITGGAGLKYFGAGASTQYRQDRVTVYLRAVATKTGKILKTVYTSKTILSQSVDASLFRFVRFKRLLETETGFTINEPSQMAVTEAIEKSVQSLIIEGVRDKLWTADTRKTDEVAALLKQYAAEQSEAQVTDIFGGKDEIERYRYSLTASGSLLRYTGDYGPSVNRTGLGLAANFGLTKNLQLQFAATSGSLAAKNYFSRDISTAELNLQYRALPTEKLCPYIQLGGGLLTSRSNSVFEFKGRKNGMVNGGLGLEYALSRRVGLNLAGQYNYFVDDKFDLAIRGTVNDSYWRASLGLSFYLGGNFRKAIKSKSL